MAKNIKNNFFESFEIIKKLGSGTYGSIFKIKNRISQEFYACKQIILHEKDHINYCDYNEFMAFQEFDHPNIVKIYDVYQLKTLDKCEYYIIMELCDNNFANILLSDCIILDSKTRIRMLGEIIKGIMYMWSKGYIHNDLSLGNILIKNNQIKIADFGFIFNKNIKPIRYHKNTIYIQPPELINGDNTICNMSKIDTWAIGQIFYAMCYNEPLIRYKQKINYYLDIVSKICIPSINIINKYNLHHKYTKLYNNLINRTSNCTEITLDMLKELSNFNEKNYPWINYLTEITPENKFIKKLSNWCVSYRPNIYQTHQIYCDIFKINELTIYNNLPSIPTKICFKEYSFSKLWMELQLYRDLFEENDLFSIHFQNKTLAYSITQYQIIIKTMNIISHLINNCFSDNNKFKCLTKIIYTENKYKQLSQINHLEQSFDRFFALAYNIYKHDTDYYMYIFNRNSLFIDYVDFQYNFIELMHQKIPNIDAYDLFIGHKINTKFLNGFKYLYYLSSSSYKMCSINNTRILSSILLILISYENIFIKKKIINQFLKLNIIITILFTKDSKIFPSYSANTIDSEIINNFDIDNNYYRLNLSSFVIEDIIIAYYIIRIINKIGYDNYHKCSKYFNIDKKFVKYLTELLSIINMNFDSKIHL
ncbi:putative serine/threonine-protein kinase [Cotonvirus japonicus]|uniref:cyclin-dependent kinase n=1 Tax=Cotonvirus japonicus TaxID=2811091 RepID=A0ABM7NSA1_9VIRU|nr:putative serine/threonine-protein kinase [Cotonvirus japonicus]BCS82977.1 putative serine/threonine-protein kinase [Cotonvirus japonicus]